RGSAGHLSRPGDRPTALADEKAGCATNNSRKDNPQRSAESTSFLACRSAKASFPMTGAGCSGTRAWYNLYAQRAQRGCAGHCHERRYLALHRPTVEHAARSEEHTSELQSLAYIVCRLLLEK